MSSVLVALLVLGTANGVALQANDPSASARNAYTRCLRQFMERSLNERMSPNDFRAALPQQCTQQEQAFRQALIAREASFRTPRAEAEETATMEVDDARANFMELFENNQPS
jgi:hypothetical protein